jgi:hypothetical protein
MEAILYKDKMTKGCVRYAETTHTVAERALQIYLTHSDAKDLGNPNAIKLVIEAIK